MDNLEFTLSTAARLRREILIGRCNVEIKLAKEAIDKAPRTHIGTELMLAHSNLHFWMAKKLVSERELVL